LQKKEHFLLNQNFQDEDFLKNFAIQKKFLMKIHYFTKLDRYYSKKNLFILKIQNQPFQQQALAFSFQNLLVSKKNFVK